MNIDSSPTPKTELENSDTRFRSVFQCAAIGIALVDLEGRPVKCNPALERILGYTEAELRAMTFRQFTHPDDLEADMQYYHGIVSGAFDHYQIEKRYLRKDGGVVWTRLTISLVHPEQGTPEFVTALVEDITDRKQAERSLREAQERELHARRDFARQLLSTAEQERQHLAAELHDGLGQTLSVIKNEAHFALSQAGLPTHAAEHLRAISQSAADAIDEVRNLVRNLRPSQVEQLGLTDSLRELLEKIAQSTSIHFELNIDNVDDVVNGGMATHLYRIVQEALNNLIRHSGAARAIVSLERDINLVRLRVADNGRGFDTTKGARNGGLGLTSIRERTQMLGGTLEIQSAPGSGTELTVILPISPDNSHEP